MTIYLNLKRLRVQYLVFIGILVSFTGVNGQGFWDQTGRRTKWDYQMSSYLPTNNRYYRILDQSQWVNSKIYNPINPIAPIPAIEVPDFKNSWSPIDDRYSNILFENLNNQRRLMENSMLSTASYSFNSRTFDLFPSVRNPIQKLNNLRRVPLDAGRFVPRVDPSFHGIGQLTHPHLKAAWKNLEMTLPIDLYAWKRFVDPALDAYKMMGAIARDISDYTQADFDFLNSKSLATSIEIGVDKTLGYPGAGNLAGVFMPRMLQGTGRPLTIDETTKTVDGIHQFVQYNVARRLGFPHVVAKAYASTMNAVAHFGRAVTWPLFKEFYMAPVLKQFPDLQQAGFNRYGTDISKISMGLPKMSFNLPSYSRHTSYSVTFSSYTNNSGNTFTHMSGSYFRTTHYSSFTQTTTWSFRDYYWRP